MKNIKMVANPGSALGEAIGTSMEKALEELLTQIVDEHGCHYITSGVRKTKAGHKAKKLLLSDKSGNEYNLDGVIANESMQPLIIFESKYIRYKKHNRDKGSWVCHAHSAVRRRYHSIRSSIAILAGNWSQSSLAMMKSHDINIFLIPFDLIKEALAKHGIDFDWGEKERDKAHVAWERYNQLTKIQQAEIGTVIIQRIADDLAASVERILDDSTPREVDKVVVELVSSFGEVKIYEFDSVEEAIGFLNQENLEEMFVTGDSASLFDPHLHLMRLIPTLDFGGVGPVLHLAHANAYPPGCYRQFVAALRPHYRVLAMEGRPLHPQSNPHDLKSWDLLADDLIRFFEQEGLENVIGVGHSMGAVATMIAAVKRPSLFRQLILIEPVFLMPDLLKMAAANPDAAYQLPLVQRALRRRNRWPSRQAAFGRFRQKPVFSRFSDEALWDYVNYATHEDGSGEIVLIYPRQWEARIYARPPLRVWERIPRVTQPTLAIRGAESDTIMPGAWQLWQELQPQATFVEIPDAGHMLTMERPSLVAQTILNYLQAQ